MLVNDLCNQSTNDKHNFEWNMMKYKLNTLHKKCFTKLVKEEGEHLSSRSALPKAALPYSAEQVIKAVYHKLSGVKEESFQIGKTTSSNSLFHFQLSKIELISH